MRLLVWSPALSVRGPCIGQPKGWPRPSAAPLVKPGWSMWPLPDVHYHWTDVAPLQTRGRTSRRPTHQTGLQKALVIPKLWLRWQLNYLKGAPVILAISVYYAWHVGFSVFWDV